ncbi:isoprenyl transferase [Peptoniphilus stercorisuis]|uniref:Isoprenyl transferase n=1 Tax=Peptoniphilus stercorisuis TaxID=1436965 RepID=A0ABS4KDM9_9FIRM|nr:isoprenyl transferase [Peptoniphilus stercorisuis]MBP2025485.1 undecaprenyl diphosphate synthase [Peptoniphilus stercorisuis]
METLKSKIDMNRLPHHIGIIMDGNGRWAKNRNLPRSMGHKEGAKRVIDIVEASYKLGIESLSLYAFSTETWKRPEEEVNKLMELLIYYIRTQLNKIIKNNIKINVMGDITKLPKKVQSEVERVLSLTKSNDQMTLNIGLNYGGRDEIIKAVKNISKEYKEGIIDIEDIDENTFSDYLYTKGQPELDLLIRSSGELRVSNFMLYQLAYCEFWFSNILWPDFKEELLYKAIIDYQNRDRRFGGI